MLKCSPLWSEGSLGLFSASLPLLYPTAPNSRQCRWLINGFGEVTFEPIEVPLHNMFESYVQNNPLITIRIIIWQGTQNHELSLKTGAPMTLVLPNVSFFPVNFIYIYVLQGKRSMEETIKWPYGTSSSHKKYSWFELSSNGNELEFLSKATTNGHLTISVIQKKIMVQKHQKERKKHFCRCQAG